MTEPQPLRIERMQIRFAGATGALHRVRPVTARAVEVLAELVRDSPPASARVDALDVPAVRIDLSRTPDEVAARAIATAAYDALARRAPDTR